MESNKPRWTDQAESILDQLLVFTSQLAESETDPQVNVRAISDACMRRLDDLMRLIPKDPKKSNDSRNEVVEKMRELYSQTQICLDILGKKNHKVAAELQNLVRTRRALGAYAPQRNPTR